MAGGPVWLKGPRRITSGFVRVKRPRGAVDLEDLAKALYAQEQLEAIAAAEAKRTSLRGRRAQPKTRGKAMLLALDVSLRMAAGKTEKQAVLELVGGEVSRSSVYAAIAANPQFFYGSKRRRRRHK